MPDRIKKLQDRIDEIGVLKSSSEWGAEYQLWKDRTERFVKDEYGNEALNLFKRQDSVVLDDEAYLRELEGRKKILEGFVKHHNEYKPKAQEQAREMSSEKSSLLTIHGDFIAGDKVGRDKNLSSTKSESWLEKYWWGLFIPIVVIAVSFIITEGRLPQLFNTWTGSATPTEQPIATSTVSLAEILNKALTLDTVVERQDFLGKYIGTTVFAQGTVSEVSRSGTSGFLIDLKVAGQTVTCPQEANDDNERQLLLLKGKKVQVVGKFPFSEVWGHGLGIDDCVLTKL
jgi:hypothetical protein